MNAQPRHRSVLMQNRRTLEIAPLGIEHESVHIHHHLSFLTVGNRPSCSTKVGKKDANSLFWPLRHFGALRKRSALLYTFEPCWGAGKSVPSASIALAKREQVWECSAGSWLLGLPSLQPVQLWSFESLFPPSLHNDFCVALVCRAVTPSKSSAK